MDGKVAIYPGNTTRDPFLAVLPEWMTKKVLTSSKKRFSRQARGARTDHVPSNFDMVMNTGIDVISLIITQVSERPELYLVENLKKPYLGGEEIQLY